MYKLFITLFITKIFISSYHEAIIRNDYSSSTNDGFTFTSSFNTNPSCVQMLRQIHQVPDDTEHKSTSPNQNTEPSITDKPSNPYEIPPSKTYLLILMLTFMLQFKSRDMLIFIFMMILLHRSAVSQVTCTTNSGTAGASIGCNNPSYTLLSCGFQTYSSTETIVYGNDIIDPDADDNQLCVSSALNGNVTVYAHCCQFGFTVSCDEFTANDGNTGDGAINTGDCTVDLNNGKDLLLGCSFTNSNGVGTLGALPFTSITDFFGLPNPITDTSLCTAETGSGNSNGASLPLLNCCSIDKGDLECVYYWISSTTETSQSITCGSSNEFMTLCTGFVDDGGNGHAHIKYE